MTNRFLLKQFAGNAENNGVFGSFQAGEKETSVNPAVIQSKEAWSNGWDDAVSSGTCLPRLEEMQGLQYVLCKAVKELYSEGIPQWMAGETYYKYSIVSFVTGDIPVLYFNKTGCCTDTNPAADSTNWESLSGGSSFQPCQIVSGFYSSDWSPDGWHACDGTEFGRALFPDIYDNYLTSSPAKVMTCTYDEYAADITAYGQCAKFAVDTAGETFKVPTIKNRIVNDLTVPVVGNGVNPIITSKNIPYSQYPLRFSGNVTMPDLVTGWGHSGDAGAQIAFTETTGLETSPGNNSNGVEVRFFVCLANGELNQSMMDWSAWASSLAGKAGVDLGNLNAAGTTKVIQSDLIDYVSPIELPVSATNVTIPSDGWLRWFIVYTNGTPNFIISGAEVGITGSSATNNAFIGWYKVKAGETYRCGTTAAINQSIRLYGFRS